MRTDADRRSDGGAPVRRLGLGLHILGDDTGGGGGGVDEDTDVGRGIPRRLLPRGVLAGDAGTRCGGGNSPLLPVSERLCLLEIRRLESLGTLGVSAGGAMVGRPTRTGVLSGEEYDKSGT